MINIAALFPNANQELLDTLNAAPATLMGVNNAIDFKDALGADDPRYVKTANARAEKFEKHFFRTFGYDRANDHFEPPPLVPVNTCFSSVMWAVEKAPS